MSARARCAVFLILAGMSGCNRDASGGRTPVVVFAASSLTETFEALESDFEAAHPQLDVQLSFAGSQVLRLQIEHGARADVFASANPQHMDALERARRVRDPQTFAHNALVVIVPRDNPAGLRAFEDLPKASSLVIGTDDVPVGRYTRAMLERVGPDFSAAVQTSVVSQESNVRLVRAKVELGEADAAIVYRTDVTPKVRALEVPGAYAPPIRYPIAALDDAPHPEAAAAFVDFVRSPAAAEVLRRRGFEPEAS